MSFDTFALETSSQKISLCHIHASERVTQWTLDSGSVYSKTPDHFVVNVFEDGTALTEGSNSSLSAGQWWYDITAGTLYVRTTDSSNPNTKTIYLLYRFFYATVPVNLPYDLASGDSVPYDGLLKPTGLVDQRLDDEQIGVAIESSTNLNFHNVGAKFDSIYDTLFWENKTVDVWVWSESINLSDKQKIFSGVIQDKRYSPSTVTFQCKDTIFKLRKPVALSLFSSSDGDLADKFLDTPKRLLFGQFKQLETIPVDNILDGFTMTGTIAGSTTTTTITGTGTSFLDECSPGDKLKVTAANGDVIELDVDSVTSDTSLETSSAPDASFSGLTPTNKPERPWRKKNRTWHISGHKLRAPSTTISSVQQDNRFNVASTTDFTAGDRIKVDGETAIIKRVSGSQFVLRQNLGSTPSVSDTVTKEPVTNCFIDSDEAIIDRDFSITNTTEAKIVFENDAELNIARQKTINGTFNFQNGSRTVTATGVNLYDFLNSRDWIRNQSTSHTTYYEILQINSETELELRVAYAGANDASASAYIKTPNLIGDDTLVTVNCVGLEESSTWRKTAADAVKYLVETDAGLTLDSDSFDEAKVVAPEILSLAIPEKPAGEIPTIRDTITKINKSVFGSLVHDASFNLVYNVLDTTKPSSLDVYKSDDIIGDFTVDSKNEIVEAVNARYRPFVDLFTREDVFTLYKFTNDFVTKSTGTKRELDVTIYLYDESDAQRIAQRYALYNSLSNSVVTFKSKLQFFTKSLNGKIWVNFERLYNRFSNRDSQKIGIISRISKSATNTQVEINDLGNVFNRVQSIAPDTANDFSSADNDEIIYNGYVCDDDFETPDTTNENMIGANIIG